MAGRQLVSAEARWGRFSLVAFCILFVVFLGNILLGKAGVAFGWRFPFLLNDVGEYLVLLFAALFFTVATLIHEHRMERRASDDAARSQEQANNVPHGGE